MAESILVDPERIALWLQLQAIAQSGVTMVHRWGPADGAHPQCSPEAHQHAVVTLAVCLNGVARIRGRSSLDLQAGEVLVIEPGCWHEHISHKRGSTSFGLGFLAGRCDVLFFDARQTLWGMVAEQPYRELCERLLDQDDMRKRCLLVEGCLSQVLCDQAKVVDWIDPEVLRMAAFLWNHLHRPIGGADVIRAARLGRSKAHMLFRAFFGRGPKQELTASRLQIAAHLLRRGFTVTAAAERCGFADRADLTRTYRRMFGLPPTASALRRAAP